MKTFELLDKTISIDTEKLSKGLCELHNENKETKSVLAFGMLDSDLCEIFSSNLKSKLIKQFEPFVYDLFKNRINDFINECENEILNGVYKYATLVV
jgi:hypothetical protein